MNNPRSTALGWGALIAAAGVSYIYAKRSIDDRRREQNASGERPAEVKDWRQRIEQPTPQRPNKDGSDFYTKAQPPDEASKSAHPTKN